MKLPSCTVRTRSRVGSKTSVNVIVVIRAASAIDSGTVYGPPPTRNVVLGGEMITCAEPRPGDVLAAGGGGADAGVTAPLGAPAVGGGDAGVTAPLGAPAGAGGGIGAAPVVGGAEIGGSGTGTGGVAV